MAREVGANGNGACVEKKQKSEQAMAERRLKGKHGNTQASLLSQGPQVMQASPPFPAGESRTPLRALWGTTASLK